MKDKDRVWIAYIIDVRGLCEEDIPRYMRDASTMLMPDDDSIRAIFIPSREGDSDVKLIYDPKGYRNKNNRGNLRLAKEYLKKVLKK